MQLVLSTFPGVDLLGAAFKLEGFCVVQAGDVIYGGDMCEEHWPAGRFEGVIGGPPCQSFSSLAHMVRHNGHKPKFGNMIPEFERVVRETQPQWFLMEEVPKAPRPVVEGYETHEFTLNNRQCYEEGGEAAVQNRVRAITFGWRGERRPLMIRTAVFHNSRFEYAACGGHHGSGGLSTEIPAKNARALARKRGVMIAIGGSGKPKPAVRRLNNAVGDNVKSMAGFAHLCAMQGLPKGFDIPAFTVAAKCKAVGNGVPRAMGRALARAVKEAIEQ